MIFNHEIQRVFTQGRQDPSGMAEPHSLLAARQQTFEHVVHAQIARGAGQHFLSLPHGLANQFDQSRRLAGTRWAMQNGHVHGGQGESNRVLLRDVQGIIEKREWTFRPERGPGFAEQHAPQFRQTIPRGRACPLQSQRLSLSGCFIHRQVETITRRSLFLTGRLIQSHLQLQAIAFADDAAPSLALFAIRG